MGRGYVGRGHVGGGKKKFKNIWRFHIFLYIIVYMSVRPKNANGRTFKLIRGILIASPVLSLIPCHLRAFKMLCGILSASTYFRPLFGLFPIGIHAHY